MRVNIVMWNAVATWRWDLPEDDVCGICQVHFDGTCPTCKYPGDDCSILSGKCGHNFHMHCILQWIKQDSAKGQCPMCRQKFEWTEQTNDTSVDTTQEPPDVCHAPPGPASASQSQSPPAVSADDALAGAEPSPPAPQQSSQHQQQPSFTSLFTLVTSSNHPNTQRQTTHHPIVHYIFANDNPEILTAALAQHHREADDEQDNDDADPDSENAPTDRAIVLDVVPTAANTGGGGGIGFKVAWASSLSPDWAVVSARVSRMEGGDGGGHGDGTTGRSSPPGALMLKIEGVSVDRSSSSSVAAAAAAAAAAAVGKGSTPPEGGELLSSGSGTRQQQQQQHHRQQQHQQLQQPATEEYTGLLQDFEKRMGVLRRVVETGEERQRRVAAISGELLGEEDATTTAGGGAAVAAALPSHSAARDQQDAKD
ncbi:anaphase-promoting complex subunit 11 RING-H2 finger-domain-containing protein [Diplogelasinospora grovesii]|uniref:Anaphase-promoting complex subunit 11 n=1 Tax=Diplogelasinospora grovesii TaxID=303347 RepID=A0AAN6MZK5_9PEZI|nr:anaphase-promoting complex subunit 11 RING-H2 finger-domain-containing protein [Diplogelasinospora grovesii]